MNLNLIERTFDNAKQFVVTHKKGIKQIGIGVGIAGSLVAAGEANTAKADGPSAVDKAIAGLGYPGVNDRDSLIEYFGMSIAAQRLQLCPGEGESACVQVPPKKLGNQDNGQVEYFELTTRDAVLQGYECGVTNVAGLPANKTVCAESVVFRPKGSALENPQLNQTLEQAIAGLKQGFSTPQELSDFLDITELNPAEWENCPAAGYDKPLPGKIEPNCARVPYLVIENKGVRTFVVDHDYESILFDGYRSPFKTDSKWADNRQRQGVPNGRWRVETMVVRQSDFYGRTPTKGY